ncbi:MAG: TatD family hydrolase [Clostridia bacterium]|nr:TatD family hydrolase [Clostridia bacterium]
MGDKNIKDTHKMLSDEAAKMGSVRMRFQGEEMITEFFEANNTEDMCRQATSGLVLVDTHAHLTDKAFEGEEEIIVGRAAECGVAFIITSGYNLSSSQTAVACAEKFDNVYASVGFYPENCMEFDCEALKEIAQNEKVVAIGEIGLQYTEGMPPKEEQIEVFEKQIKLAHELNLPIVIHCREAYGDCLEVLKRNQQFLKAGGTLHCYCGSSEMAKEFIRLGLHISVGGVSTFKNADKIKKAVIDCPLERILLETDCPYLAPHPFRGKRNEPSLIPTIAENLATLKGISVEEVVSVTTQNARRLFKI